MLLQEVKHLLKMMKKQTLKNYILLSIIVLSQLHVAFRYDSQRVDWFLFIDYTRRIDFAVMYLCKHLIYVIYAYMLLFPKGLSRNVKVFIFILSIYDLLHFFTTSHIGGAEIKLILTLITYLLYNKIKK